MEEPTADDRGPGCHSKKRQGGAGQVKQAHLHSPEPQGTFHFGSRWEQRSGLGLNEPQGFAS